MTPIIFKLSVPMRKVILHLPLNFLSFNHIIALVINKYLNWPPNLCTNNKKNVSIYNNDVTAVMSLSRITLQKYQARGSVSPLTNFDNFFIIVQISSNHEDSAFCRIFLNFFAYPTINIALITILKIK